MYFSEEVFTIFNGIGVDIHLAVVFKTRHRFHAGAESYQAKLDLIL